MSTERDIMASGNIPAASLAAAQEQDSAAVRETREAKKARLTRILERGFVHDRLHVDLPDTLYGEWIGNDQASIMEAETLGFKMDYEYAGKQLRGMHDVGDGRAVIGDVVFMVMDREDKEIHEEIRREAFELANGKPGQARASQGEEKIFSEKARKEGLPIVQESQNRQARKAEIEAALRSRAGVDPGAISSGVPHVDQIR